MGCSNVAKIEALTRVSQTFEEDGIYLTPASRKLFVNPDTRLFQLWHFLLSNLKKPGRGEKDDR
jgi:hypothetical protein